MQPASLTADLMKTPYCWNLHYLMHLKEKTWKRLGFRRRQLALRET